MKITISTTFSVLLLILLVSCNAPRGQRLSTFNGYESNAQETGDKSDGELNFDDTGEQGPTPNLPSDVSSDCSLSTSAKFAKYHNIVGGGYNICQSTENPNKIYIQVERDTNSKICMFPVKQSDNSTAPSTLSVTCEYLKADVVHRFHLPSNSSDTNAVMIMQHTTWYFAYPYPNEPTLITSAYAMCIESLYRYGDKRYCNSFLAEGKYKLDKF